MSVWSVSWGAAVSAEICPVSLVTAKVGLVLVLRIFGRPGVSFEANFAFGTYNACLYLF
jgi:hypothetical protein